MESQYNVVGENVFLHRMEVNSILLTKGALIVAFFFTTLYNLVAFTSGAFFFMGLFFQICFCLFGYFGYKLYVQQQEESEQPEFGQVWTKLKTKLGAAAFHGVAGLVTVFEVIILESEDEVNKYFQNLPFLFGIGWVGAALFLLNAINYFIINFSIHNDAPRSASAPLPRPRNEMFTTIHQILRPMTKSAQVVMIVFALLVFIFNIVNKVNRGYGFVCLILLATIAELNTYSDDGQGERELFTIFGTLNTFLARGIFYFLSAWAVFYFILVMEGLPYEIDAKTYLDEIIQIIGVIDMAILFGLSACYQIMHLMIKDDINSEATTINEASLYRTNDRTSGASLELPHQKAVITFEDDDDTTGESVN